MPKLILIDGIIIKTWEQGSIVSHVQKHFLGIQALTISSRMIVSGTYIRTTGLYKMQLKPDWMTSKNWCVLNEIQECSVSGPELWES